MIPLPLNININLTYNRVDNSVHNTNINNHQGLGLSEDDTKKLQSDVQKALEINVKDEVSVLTAATATISSNSLSPQGSLKMTKITNNPAAEELELIKQARGNKPYNSIFDVRIERDEQGNVTDISWSEN